MVKRYAHRVDSNQPPIVDGLRAAYRSVEILNPRGKGGLPDLLVGYGGVNYLLEIKSDKGKTNKEQDNFIADWRGLKPIVVRDLEQALEATSCPGAAMLAAESYAAAKALEIIDRNKK